MNTKKKKLTVHHYCCLCLTDEKFKVDVKKYSAKFPLYDIFQDTTDDK